MKKIIFFIITMIFLISCQSLEKKETLKVNIVRENRENEKIKVYLYSYDERIADKAATLLLEKEIELSGKESTTNFLVPKETVEDTYYIVLDRGDSYMLDYSNGGIEKLKIDGINKVKIIRIDKQQK